MSARSYSEYCSILGIDEHATLTDIKKAYRRKAILVHPDLNKSPGAHQEFVLLVEAYQYLVDMKTGKISRSARHTTYNDVRRQEKAREEARQRAREYARMRYEQFTAVKEYPKPMFDFMAHIFFFFYLLLLLLVPVVLVHYFDTDGIIGTALTWALTAPITIGTWRYRPRLEMKKFFRSLGELMQGGRLFGVVFLLFSLVMLVTVDLVTMLTPAALALLLFLSMLISTGWGWMRQRRKKPKSYYALFNMAFTGPALVHLLLFINFAFSHSPVKEQYHFRYQWKTGEARGRFTKYIHLDYGQYDEFPALRTFGDQHRIRSNRHIVYTFRQGLLGIPVMTDYAFLP